MDPHMHALIDKLSTDHHLRDDEYLELIENRSEEAAELLAQRAVEARQPIYGTMVFTRGLIEISNICKNDCIYCGIRRSNQNVERYR
ncbi:MAG: [FeFe] hydrogenase H-cluster radical SAM maturase HydE, partial [Atopobiaceae bacterium]|nr:[FeFe] hydrogenase H-cluster radical SAM maturase HydE [Atopobiaceae bacterium]